MTNEEDFNYAGKRLLVTTWDSGQGYDWRVLGLFEDSTGLKFVSYDAGCSCNSPWDLTEWIDFIPVASAQEAIAWSANKIDQTAREAFTKEVLKWF